MFCFIYKISLFLSKTFATAKVLQKSHICKQKRKIFLQLALLNQKRQPNAVLFVEKRRLERPTPTSRT